MKLCMTDNPHCTAVWFEEYIPENLKLSVDTLLPSLMVSLDNNNINWYHYCSLNFIPKLYGNLNDMKHVS